MRIGVLREITNRERRVALTPSAVSKLVGDGHEVSVEVGAGLKAGFADDAYRQAGANVNQRSPTVAESELIAQITGPSIADLAAPEWSALSAVHTLVGLHDPLWRFDEMDKLADTGATIVSLELVPRITRAQSMDVLSSMATVAGYQAVLVAASRSGHMFPLLMTAAGTNRPARVLVLGAGVAGLQAIATARRLGAVVEAYDIRPAATEQIESMGATAITLDIDDDVDSGDDGGYARRQSSDVARRQQDALATHLARADVVITTAAVPGERSPELITTEMVEAMAPGSVIVDLAAERGGNCRLTDPDSEVVHNGVVLLGPTDLASRAAGSASSMFATNLVSLINHLNDEGRLVIDLDDEITAATVVASEGRVHHPRVLERLGRDEHPEGDEEE